MGIEAHFLQLTTGIVMFENTHPGIAYCFQSNKRVGGMSVYVWKLGRLKVMWSFCFSQFLTPYNSQGHYRGDVDGHIQKSGSRQEYELKHGVSGLF